VLFLGTAVTMHRLSFFSIRIIPLSPTFASLFCFQLCRIFVFDCWKVLAILLCFLVHVVLVVFQSPWAFICTKKGGATKKSFSIKIALQFDAVAPYI
jgi:hypothetical protein